MGSGGHNIKPLKDLKKEGTYRKDRHRNRVESVAIKLNTVPKPPANFDQTHVKKWNEVCEKVFKLGILAEQDTDILEMYVRNWVMWDAACMEVKKRGITFTDGDRIIKNPAFAIMQESGKVVQQIASLLGFSPRARMGIKTDPQEEADPFADFLKN